MRPRTRKEAIHDGHQESSGNVFADLGFADPDTHALKAALVHRISMLIKRENLTQADAAKRMGISQPDVSKMLKGHFRPFSLERLMRVSQCARPGCRDRCEGIPAPSPRQTECARALEQCWGDAACAACERSGKTLPIPTAMELLERRPFK